MHLFRHVLHSNTTTATRFCVSSKRNLVNLDILGTIQTFGPLHMVVREIICHAEGLQAGYFCVSNTHQLVLGKEDQSFCNVQHAAVASFPDSMVLAASAALMGGEVKLKDAFRGYDLFRALLTAAVEHKVSVGFYGGSTATLSVIRGLSKRDFPDLEVAFECSPPFRPLTQPEMHQIVEEIDQSNVGLLFVGIGCPKQEVFMNQAVGMLARTTMIGVGAAFDFYAGAVRPSPNWVHQAGLEWLYRLVSEPRRLGRRYLEYNSKYLLYFAKQWLYGRSEK